ncbi:MULTISPECIES: type II and III secretion system protein family protein [Salinivibrio]|uniref:General secretion pathway protein GspD n=1 Tax=Salinivibrio kushneri TaxID=1908198 RepID=A0AB36JWD8_9GAMM|nr:MULTISPECIES: pilus assembly protein N-terminal domain-containing protein [Salinivibrio]ODP97617.1 general secretion pathway protein GspD [Salinivibrio sp. BNH]OOE34357.1 general secretion pathway protein GspD [Salinivibrio kushneri]OOE37677.1 general secretion pathway protein GspD [Salinivibrio kushneri]OOE38887.1 general secretion pathway protein GspD [Salinivibrio kushneri]OOE48737.1 general secretion pathway protein GspD [Salinivibrio kushneri]
MKKTCLYLRWMGLMVISLAVLAAQASTTVMNLPKGQAQAFHVNKVIGSVFIADPAIADYQVIDKQKVVAFGKTVGSTTLLVFDEEGKTIVSRQLIVNQSMVHLQQQIQLRYPELDVSIYNLAEQVVLSGLVASEEQKQDIERLVGELLSKPSTQDEIEWDTGDETYNLGFMRRYRYEGIVNNLEVATTKQVNVQLTVAEVSNSFMEKFGVDFSSGGRGSGIFVNPLKRFSASDIITVISAVGDDNVGQVLAEPNLSVLSGETASFLVGGELPVVTRIDGGVNVQYREYGVKLELAADVRRDDKIKLALMPEVSSLDQQFSNDAYDLPALKTRRARTTVELGDGESFVLGGLLNSEERESLSKIPFVGDIPILGALFRHTETQRNKTELVIIAKVNLVKPIQSDQVVIPRIQRTSTLERFFALDAVPEQAPLRQWLRKGGFIQ